MAPWGLQNRLSQSLYAGRTDRRNSYGAAPPFPFELESQSPTADALVGRERIGLKPKNQKKPCLSLARGL